MPRIFIAFLWSQSTETHPDVKPFILSCFGDLAMDWLGQFEPFLASVMPLLRLAAEVKAASHSDDDTAYVHQLQVSVFEGYTGILLGLCDAGRHNVFAPFCDDFFRALTRIAHSSILYTPTLEKALSFAGDLYEHLRHLPEVAQRLASETPMLEELIETGLDSRDARCEGAVARLQAVRDRLLQRTFIHLLAPFSAPPSLV
jgi:hypothetical protein